VSRRARIRAAAAASVALVVGLLLASGVVPNTFSLWEAEATNAGSVYAGGWIPAPAGAHAPTIGGASNSTVTLSWTTAGGSAAEPNPNPVTGQQLQIADGGSGASASCGTYGNEGSALTATATSTTDSGGSVPAADWWCYQMISTSATSWTSNPTTFTPTRLLVPTSVQFVGNANGKIDSGEQIVITFNQSVGASSVPINNGICQVKGATTATSSLIIGYSGTCGPGSSYSIGKVTNILQGPTGGFTASVSASGAQVTVTATNKGTTVGTGGTFVAASSVTASSGSPAACTSGSGPTCTVTPSGAF
jgi:hypothetical protein